VPDHLVRKRPAGLEHDPKHKRAALLGSFWDQSWFDRLCSVFEQCHVDLDWYGQSRSPWLKFPAEDLARAHIKAHGIIPEERLAMELRKYPFVVVPVGALDEKEKNKGVASLSLPGRILFTAATSHTPLLVVGSEETCGARFVSRFGLGIVAPYDVSAVITAIDRLSDEQVQMAARANAAAIAPMLSDSGVVEWFVNSIQQGRPADNRFEDVFSRYNVVPDQSLMSSPASDAPN